jgi:hypothetical protein
MWMMKSKKLLILGIGIIILILFINRANREQFKIEQSKLENIEKLKVEISKQLPDGAELLSSAEGEFSHLMYFKASDGVERAVIPYKKDSSKKPLNLMVLEKSKDVWVEKDRLPLVGEDFDKVVFKDITGDGGDEMIVGLKIGKSSTRGLSVYGYGDGELEELLSDNYEDLFVADFDSDEIGEIVLLKNNSKEKRTEINYYEYKGGSLDIIDSIALDDSEAKVDLKLEQINRDKKGLIAELETDSKKGVLSVFKVEGNNLERLSLLGKKSIENPFFVASKDVDGDGIFEFPILKASPGLEQEDNLTWITEWYGLNQDYSELSVIKREYTDYQATFTLDFFENWGEDIVIKRSPDRSGEVESVEFISALKGEGEKPLFGISVYKIEDWGEIPKESREEKEIITKSQDRVYVLDSRDDEYSLEKIKSRFRVLDLKED